MSLDWKRIDEARQGYIDKRNKENEKKALEKGLTEKQISAIEDICRLRHKIHTTDIMEIYNMNDDADESLNEIECLIKNTDLPSLNMPCYVDDWLTTIDWDELGDTTRPEYYEKAQKEIDNGFVFGKGGMFPINDIDDLAENLWLEHVSEVNSKIIEEINDKIEDWLRAIDEKYGTHYEPTGGQRLH